MDYKRKQELDKKVDALEWTSIDELPVWAEEGLRDNVILGNTNIISYEQFRFLNKEIQAKLAGVKPDENVYMFCANAAKIIYCHPHTRKVVN